jgi:hypothetical protein
MALKRSAPEGAVDKNERKRQQRAEKEERKRQQQAEKEQRKLDQQAQREEAKRQQEFQTAWDGFWASAAGQARHAFNVGDHVFQYNVDVMNQQAIIVAMVGSNTKQSKADPTSILNSVCREGWELVNGDFVFVTTGQQSRDKFLSSGQNVAVAGTVMGYYLFKRCEENRVPETEDELRTRLGA